MAWTYENDTKILARTKTFCYDFGKIGKKTSLKKSIGERGPHENNDNTGKSTPAQERC